MQSRRSLLVPAVIASLLPCAASAATQDVVRLGAGSYAAAAPPGAKSPPAEIFQTENIRGPMPTNDWWSSLAWMPFSEPMYAHPLAFRAVRGGLRVFYPGDHITADGVGIYGSMPGGGDDVVLGHSVRAEFPDARVDGFSDWFVSARFAAGGRSLRVSFGHGSPYVYARYEGGNPRLTFPRPPPRLGGRRAGAVADPRRHRRRHALRALRACRLDLERDRHRRPDEPVRQAVLLDGPAAG